MLTLSIALGSFGARMSHMRKWNALAFKRPRIQDAQMETTYRVLTREVLEWARAFKGRRGRGSGEMLTLSIALG